MADETQEMVTDESQDVAGFQVRPKENVHAVMLDRETVQMMAEKHGKLVYVDARKGRRYFALPGLHAGRRRDLVLRRRLVRRARRAQPGVDDRRGIPGREGVRDA